MRILTEPLIRERTQAGLHAARARGRTGGRPKALTLDQQALAVKLYDEKQHTVAQICRMLGISKPTLYKYLAAGKEMGQGRMGSAGT